MIEHPTSRNDREKNTNLLRLGKFTSISGRQRTTKIQYLVVHKYLWSSSGILRLQNSRKTGKIGIFFNDNLSKSSSHVDDQN